MREGGELCTVCLGGSGFLDIKRRWFHLVRTEGIYEVGAININSKRLCSSTVHAANHGDSANRPDAPRPEANSMKNPKIMNRGFNIFSKRTPGCFALYNTKATPYFSHSNENLGS